MDKKKKILMFVLTTLVLTFAFGVTCFASSNIEIPDSYPRPSDNSYKYYTIYVGSNNNTKSYYICWSKTPLVATSVKQFWLTESSDAICFVYEGGKWVQRHSPYNPYGDIKYHNFDAMHRDDPTQIVKKKLDCPQLNLSLIQIQEMALTDLQATLGKSQTGIATVALLILSSMVSVVLLVRFGKRWFH